MLGRPRSFGNGAGTTCTSYDSEDRLTASRAPGESQDTTYLYDPAGNIRTTSDANGTVGTIYNEAGAPIDNTDSYGAEMELIYDADGNVTSRRVATGPIPTSTVYTSNYSYDDDYRPATQTDPTGKQWSFYYDNRSNLQAIQQPNGTFTWQTYNNDGWQTQQLNRHGTLPRTQQHRSQTQTPSPTSPTPTFPTVKRPANSEPGRASAAPKQPATATTRSAASPPPAATSHAATATTSTATEPASTTTQLPSAAKAHPTPATATPQRGLTSSVTSLREQRRATATRPTARQPAAAASTL